MPRQIMQIPRFVTPSSELDLRSWKAQNGDGESLAPAGSHDPLIWKTGGFPFDGYHLVTTTESSNLAIDWRVSLLNLAINAMMIVGLLVLALRQSEPLWHEIRRTLSNTNLRQRGLFGFTTALVLTLMLLWGWQGFAQRDVWLRDPAVRSTTSLSPKVERYVPRAVAKLWKHPLAIQLTQNALLTREPHGSWKSWQPASIQFLSDTTQIHHSELTRLANQFPLVHTVSGSLTSIRPAQWLRPDRIRTLKVQGPTNTAHQALNCSMLSNLRDLTSLRCDWDTLAKHGFPASLESLECEVPSTQPVEVADLPLLQRLRIVLRARSSIRPTDCLAIHARHLPRLQRIYLPADIDLDLELTELPLLSDMLAVDSFPERRPSRFGHNRGGPARFFGPYRGIDDFGFRGRGPNPRGRGDAGEASTRPIVGSVVRVRSIRAADVPRLTTITAQVSDRSSIDLAQATHLRELHLATHWKPGSRGRRPTAVWLADLGGIESLRTITLQGFHLWDADFSSLTSLPSLASLDLTDSMGPSRSLECFSGMRRMRHLIAPDFDLEQATVERLVGANRNWERLILNWNELTSLELANLPRLVSIVPAGPIECENVVLRNLPRLADTLTLARGTVSPSEPGHTESHVILDQLDQLTRLKIQHHSLTNTTLRSLTKLREVTIHDGGDVTPAIWDSLRKLDDLNRLRLDSCHLSPVYCFDHDWRGLRELDLAGCGVTDSQLLASPGLTQLQRLILDHTGIGPDSLIALKHMRRLQLLSVSDTRLGHHELKALEELPMLVAIVADHIKLFPEALRDKQVTQASIRQLAGERDDLRLDAPQTRVARPIFGRGPRRGA